MVYLEGRYSPQGDQGLKWEEDLGQTTLCPPGTSHAWAWGGTGARKCVLRALEHSAGQYRQGRGRY